MDVDFEVLVLNNARQGNERAWSILFDQHFQAVYCYCLSVTGGRQDVAEEIVQQTFVTAARRISSFRPDRGAFRAWLHGIARNRFAKYELKEVRRKRHESRGNAECSQKEDGHLQQLMVYETIAHLPIRYRLVLEAKYFDGLTVDEIAEAQGCTAKAVESCLSRARKKFSQIHKQLHGLCLP